MIPAKKNVLTMLAAIAAALVIGGVLAIAIGAQDLPHGQLVSIDQGER